MRRSLTLFICVLLVLGMQTNVHASSDNVLVGMGRKFLRGVVNATTGIIEWPMQTYKGYTKGLPLVENQPISKTVGTVLGFFRGVGHTGARTLYGVIDVTFFWTANPEDNQGVGIPLDAEYAWQIGEQYSIIEPNIKEGLMPYPRKLGRGAANHFLGILEIPGQIVKGATSERKVTGTAVGIVKGVWFAGSRWASGLSDLFLFLIPNPAENAGYAFEEKWPWTVFTEGP